MRVKEKKMDKNNEKGLKINKLFNKITVREKIK
jgi:hypothetical protein